MNIFPENTVLNEITDFTDRNVDIFSTKSNLWNKSDNDSKLLDHHLFGKLEQNQNFKKVERNSPTNKSTLSLHITAYENGIIENSENTINVFNATQSKFDFGFEFPRQQDDGNGAPDGMQFKSNQKLLDPNGADDEQSEEDDKKDVISATPQEIIDEINSKGETIVQEWHKTITKNPPKIDAFLDLNNATKNRFPNVLLYDSTRVRIKDKHGSDYYHASHVDAFGKPGGYILAQAPFEENTETDFWRMCYQQKPSLIVLLTSLIGAGGKRMAKNFWPNAKQEREFCNGIRVRCTNMVQDRIHDTYDLMMFGQNSRKSSGGIKTQLIQFNKWIDDRQIPDNLLEFRASVKIASARAEKDERAGSCVMLVCPSGVHRCGTLAALDILLDRIAAERKVGLIETINNLRKQRYGCFTHFEHYAHISDLIVRHSVSSGIVDPNFVGVRTTSGRQALKRGNEADDVNDFVASMTTGGKTHLLAEHNTLRKKERHVFYFMRNPTKNRYSNVVLFNEGAVILDRQNKDEGTYIHATKLQSKYGRFILAQAPKPDTLFDWYRMIWQCNVRVIVCLTSLENSDDCAKYFNKKSGKSVSCKRFSVKTFAVRPENSVTTYELRVKNSSAKGDEKERVIHVVHYAKWNINRSPDPRHLLHLLRATWALEQSMGSVCDAREAPTLVHGSSGVRRTGAYVIISMLCRQLREKGTVSIIAACSTVRKYRYGVMRNKIMFATMLETVLNFAADQGMVDRNSKAFSSAHKKIRIALMERNKDEGGSGAEGGEEDDE